MTCEIKKFCSWEDVGVSLMARIFADDAALVLQADVSTITYKIFDIDSPATELNSGSLTVADVIFDTLQTDARWTADTTGYNFRWTAPGTELNVGSKNYRVEIYFTPAAGGLWAIVYEGELRQLLGS